MDPTLPLTDTQRVEGRLVNLEKVSLSSTDDDQGRLSEEFDVRLQMRLAFHELRLPYPTTCCETCLFLQLV